jgi:hypothetical protein
LYVDAWTLQENGFSVVSSDLPEPASSNNPVRLITDDMTGANCMYRLQDLYIGHFPLINVNILNSAIALKATPLMLRKNLLFFYIKLCMWTGACDPASPCMKAGRKRFMEERKC